VRRLVPLALLLFIAAGCEPLPGEENITGTLIERLERRSDYSLLTDLLGRTGTRSLFDSGTEYTVIAPTDLAFRYAGEDFVDALREDNEALTRVVRHHLVEGRLAPEDFVDGGTLRTIDGRELAVSRTGPIVRIDGVTLDLEAAIDVEGGVAYPTGGLLLGALTVKERIAFSPSLSLFELYASRAGVFDDVSGERTVLAPLNDAISALGRTGDRLFFLTSNDAVFQRVMDFHVVPGETALTPGGSAPSLGGAPLQVRETDGVTSVGLAPVLRRETLADGTLLVLGGVILEPLTLAERLRIETLPQMYSREVQDLLPDTWARLEDAGGQEYTLLAPSDRAYEARGLLLNTALGDERNAALNLRLVRAHIVEGRWTREDLTDGLTLTALDGTTHRISKDARGRITVSGRELTQGISAANGQLYSLGNFLSPAVDAFDTALLQGFTEHVAAVRRAGLEDLFRTPGVTAFIANDSLYAQDPGTLQNNPEPFLRHNITRAPIPVLEERDVTFEDGSTEAISYRACGGDGPEEEDRACSPWRFQDNTQIYQGSASFDGQSYLHQLRELHYPGGH